jgi:hypothetical protein
LPLLSYLLRLWYSVAVQHTEETVVNNMPGCRDIKTNTMTPEQDKRWWVLKARIDKMEAEEGKLANLRHMVEHNKELREAIKAKHGEYPVWTEERDLKHKARLKRMNSIRFTWVVELVNLMH